jgi:hypothetical protein
MKPSSLLSGGYRNTSVHECVALDAPIRSDSVGFTIGICRQEKVLSHATHSPSNIVGPQVKLILVLQYYCITTPNSRVTLSTKPLAPRFPSIPTAQPTATNAAPLPVPVIAVGKMNHCGGSYQPLQPFTARGCFHPRLGCLYCIKADSVRGAASVVCPCPSLCRGENVGSGSRSLPHQPAATLSRTTYLGRSHDDQCAS